MRVCCIRDMAASVGQKKEICSDGFWTVTSQHWRDFLANCRFWVLRVSNSGPMTLDFGFEKILLVLWRPKLLQ